LLSVPPLSCQEGCAESASHQSLSRDAQTRGLLEPSTKRADRPLVVSTPILRLSKTAHRSIDSCQHHHCVECSHQKPQLRSPRACRLHNSSVEAAAVKTSKGARRWERSSGSIAEPAGTCGPNQQRRRKSLSRVLVQNTWSAPMHPLSVLDLYWSLRGEVACDDHAPEVDLTQTPKTATRET
jgi:hypothetical protein